jgi:3',5'-cyclic AMP phosphodiesterase CpdA
MKILRIALRLRFVVGGDSRRGGPEWPEIRDAMTRLAASHDPDFVCFTGDFVMSWNDQNEWDNWLRAWYLYARASDNRLIPLVPVIGNHEVLYPQPADYDPETEATNYYSQFNLPGNERWYSLSFGGLLHLVVLDSEIRAKTSAAWENQLAWLRQDLQAHRDHRWIVALGHRPVYTSGKYYPGDSLLQDWAEEFGLFGVDLYFAGHDHGYERTGPINVLKNPQGLVPADEGTIYVVSAGWGAPLYPGAETRPWFSETGHLAEHNIVVVELDAWSLRMTALNENGEPIDSLNIGGAPPATPLALYAIGAMACAALVLVLLRRR